MTNKKGSTYFKTELSLIKNELIKEFVIKILNDDVYEGNFINAASSTGKYHPTFANDKNGLVNHTKAVAKVAYVLCNARPDIDSDIILASCILHDMMKYSASYNYTSMEHAEAMYNHIIRFYVNSDSIFNSIKNKISDIALIIKYHMGYFGSESINEYLNEINNTKIRDMILLVHYSDMIVSRHWYGTDDVYLKVSKGKVEC